MGLGSGEFQLLQPLGKKGRRPKTAEKKRTSKTAHHRPVTAARSPPKPLVGKRLVSSRLANKSRMPRQVSAVQFTVNRPQTYREMDTRTLQTGFRTEGQYNKSVRVINEGEEGTKIVISNIDVDTGAMDHAFNHRERNLRVRQPKRLRSTSSYQRRRARPSTLRTQTTHAPPLRTQSAVRLKQYKTAQSRNQKLGQKSFIPFIAIQPVKTDQDSSSQQFYKVQAYSQIRKDQKLIQKALIENKGSEKLIAKKMIKYLENKMEIEKGYDQLQYAKRRYAKQVKSNYKLLFKMGKKQEILKMIEDGKNVGSIRRRYAKSRRGGRAKSVGNRVKKQTILNIHHLQPQNDGVKYMINSKHNQFRQKPKKYYLFDHRY